MLLYNYDRAGRQALLVRRCGDTSSFVIFHVLHCGNEHFACALPVRRDVALASWEFEPFTPRERQARIRYGVEELGT